MAGSIRILICLLGIASISFGNENFPTSRDWNIGNLRGVWTGPLNIGNSFLRLPDDLLKRLPNAADIITWTVESLQTLPSDIVQHGITDLCFAAKATDGLIPVVLPRESEWKLDLILDEHRNISFEMEDLENIRSHSDFNEHENVVVFISGLNSNEPDYSWKKLMEAYKCRGTLNFFVVDAGRFISNVYDFVSFDTERAGKHVGELLVRLLKHVPHEKLHVIGHGIGALIAGRAGRLVMEKTGRPLVRITALDPALRCYWNPEGLIGLQRDDAEFVDAIHTTPHVLGVAHSVGDIDYYINGVTPQQPGCNNIICAHYRALDLFTETVLPGHGRNLLGVRCHSIREKCTGTRVPLGIDAPKDVTGNFFVQTNRRYPFGIESRNVRSMETCLGVF